jgi:hypothetical protein
MIAHRRQHRIIFVLAGIYNLLWGLYAAYDPQWLFRFALPDRRLILFSRRDQAGSSEAASDDRP